MSVDAGARVAIPMPYAADLGARVDHAHRQPELAQFVQLVEASKAGAHNNDIKVDIRRSA